MSAPTVRVEVETDRLGLPLVWVVQRRPRGAAYRTRWHELWRSVDDVAHARRADADAELERRRAEQPTYDYRVAPFELVLG